MNLTKPQLKDRLGFVTDVQLAAFFDTTKQAVSQWGEDEPIPEGRQWQARALRPDVIPEPTKEGKVA